MSCSGSHVEEAREGSVFVIYTPPTPPLPHCSLFSIVPLSSVTPNIRAWILICPGMQSQMILLVLVSGWSGWWDSCRALISKTRLLRNPYACIHPPPFTISTGGTNPLAVRSSGLWIRLLPSCFPFLLPLHCFPLLQLCCSSPVSIYVPLKQCAVLRSELNGCD